MNPQQGARRLPFLENILIKNPSRRSLVMGAARDVVIRRWVRRVQPSSKVLERPPP